MEELNICISTFNCKLLKITDNTLWEETVPNEDIILTRVTITQGNTSHVVEVEGYTKITEITDFGPFVENGNFKDGFYTIKVDYVLIEEIDDEPEVAVSQTNTFLNKCNLQCKYYNLILSTLDCDDCNEKKWDILFKYKSKIDVIDAALVCKDIDTAKKLFEYLQNLMVNVKCDNC